VQPHDVTVAVEAEDGSGMSAFATDVKLSEIRLEFALLSPLKILEARPTKNIKMKIKNRRKTFFIL
jgi:hypothetical protein